MANPVSTANLFGHRTHPMLIPFPIAFFVATFVCDVAFWLTGNTSWVTATWLLGAGLGMAALGAWRASPTLSAMREFAPSLRPGNMPLAT